MSKRGHIINQTEPLPPFAENLVFWAPLTEGDLTDHISGVSPTTDSGCSVTWDAVKGMYRLYAYNKKMSSLKYDCLHGVIPENHNISIVIDIEEVSISNIYNFIFGLPPYEYGAAPYNYNMAYLRHDRYNNSTTNRLVGRLCVVYDDKILRFYKDGVFVKTYDWSQSTSPIKTDIGNVRINQIPNNYGYNGTIYAKNARIYNRALTASEVAQL